MAECPCEGCITFPVCRNKNRLQKLTDDCSILDDYLKTSFTMYESLEKQLEVCEMMDLRWNDHYFADKVERKRDE